MKKIFNISATLAIAVGLLVQSCKEAEIPVFQGDNYVQFSRPLQDSLTCTFLDAPDTSHKHFPIGLELIGSPSTQERILNLRILVDASTATSSHYELPETITFKPNSIRDTIWIKVLNTPDIKENPVKIVYQLQPSKDFQVGELEYVTGVLYFTNKIARPAWWRGTVESSYLGAYSDKKYDLLIQLTGQVDLNPDDLLDVMDKALIIKNYLMEQKDAGNTIYEDNGTEMKVALISA